MKKKQEFAMLFLSKEHVTKFCLTEIWKDEFL